MLEKYLALRARPGAAVSRSGAGFLLVGDRLADHLNTLRSVVDIAAFGLEKRLAVLFGLQLGARIRCGETRLDTFGDELFRFGDQSLDHLVLGHDPHYLALDEQVPLVAPGRYPEIGLAGLAGPVDTQPITAT